jgi:hypothetical protein
MMKRLVSCLEGSKGYGLLGRKQRMVSATHCDQALFGSKAKKVAPGTKLEPRE